MKQIIRRPLVSEKNSMLAEQGVYSFEVDLKTDKKEIRAAVEKDFGVKVQSVRTQLCRGRGKMNKFGMGQIPRWKKAFVKLKAGEKISLFEGV